jgi:disulfide bond formation protein DsbB
MCIHGSGDYTRRPARSPRSNGVRAAFTFRCVALRYNPPSMDQPLPMNSHSRAPDNWTLVFACWLIASVSALGSLFFSEVMGHLPCVLCWYQRICMYPLAFILPAGLFPYDRNVVRYALPLSLLGLLLAIFHLLLVAGVIPENIKPCVQGIPCTEVQIVWFGFVTIPLLSALSFLLITALLVAAHVRSAE